MSSLLCMSEQKFLNDRVGKSVVTVPAYFNLSKDGDERYWSDCCLEILRIINEPTAASLAYG
uniref:Uncharacterized protein n=1 Tax=Cucumis sativus TaxID=3659 RepID=A0A0A0L233_CUCSA